MKRISLASMGWLVLKHLAMSDDTGGHDGGKDRGTENRTPQDKVDSESGMRNRVEGASLGGTVGAPYDLQWYHEI